MLMLRVSHIVALFSHHQIADFGMARDLSDENFYVSHGGEIPVKWTAPEVTTFYAAYYNCKFGVLIYRHLTIRDTPLPVMCGALVVSCMRYGVLDMPHTKFIQTSLA